MTRVYELFLPPQSPPLRLILSILGCDFCSPTTVSVPVTELWKETSGLNRWFEEKGTTCWRGAAGRRGELSQPLRFPPPAFRSSSITRGDMRGKGHEVMWQAMQHFSFLLHSCSRIIQQSGDTWGQKISNMLFALFPIFTLYIFIYTVHDLPDGITWRDYIIIKYRFLY